jgi:putative phage-type endonuclease
VTTEAKAPAIVRSEREAWLAERRKLIGASDVAAILGEDPSRSPLSVWAEKVGRASDDETPFMRWGRKAEALAAEVYAEETGRPVVIPASPYELHRHPDLPWLAATLDRRTGASAEHPAPVEIVDPRHAHGPLECKNAGPHKVDEWREDPPTRFVIQLQIQIACTGAEWGTLAALVGWPPAPAWRDFARDNRFLAAALPLLEEFHLRVERRDPPTADGRPATTDAIRRLWQVDDGETIDLGPDALDLVEEWERADHERAQAEGRAQEAENRLKAALASATYGRLPDGTYLTLKTTAVKAHTKAVAAYSYRRLRRWRPKLKRR